MNYHIEFSLESNEEFSDFLMNRIKEYNNQHSIHHREIRKEGAVLPLSIIVSDDEQHWIGGIAASVYWNWLEIDYIWFREEFRNQGLGRTLIAKIEEMAKEKGATRAKLTTFEFQALLFYEKLGYEVVGEIKDYPPGSSYYTMVKVLS